MSKDVIGPLKARKRVQLGFNDVSLTHQSFKEECDVNTIMRRWVKTGELPVGSVLGRYDDVSLYGDYRECLDIVNRAGDAFCELPAFVRKRFNNDPAEMLDFVSNPSNIEEAVQLGLIDKASEPVVQDQKGKDPEVETSAQIVT